MGGVIIDSALITAFMKSLLMEIVNIINVTMSKERWSV